MKLFFCLFCAGIISASLLAKLPSLNWLLIAIAIVFFSVVLFSSFPSSSFLASHYIFNSIRFILWVILGYLMGFSYGVYSGYQALDNRLPINLQEQFVVVQGFVTGLPQDDERHQQFQFLVTRVALARDFDSSGFNIPIKFPSEISIALYDAKDSSKEKIVPGNFRQFRIKVKRPRALVNPHGYDSEVAQIRRSVGATAYVRTGKDSLLLETPRTNQLLFLHPLITIDRIRFDIRNWLMATHNISQSALLTALLIGDTSAIDKQEWLRFNKTGTLHLIAISGLHLGFFALIGFFIGKLVGRSFNLICYRCDAFLVAHLFALVFVVAYAFLAGLNIPTLRTLIMLLIVQFAWWVKRNPPGFYVWCIALAAVLLFDPFSIYDKGFWLSFIAVGLLIFYFSGRAHKVDSTHWKNKTKLVAAEFIKSQWLMLIGLLIPLSLLGAQVSLCAPIANLVAIPLVTFFVVPFLILASLLHPLSDTAYEFMLKLADFGASFFQSWLDLVLRWNDSALFSSVHNLTFKIPNTAIPLAILSIILILLPKGLRNTWLGFLGVTISFLMPMPDAPPLEVLTFDVGQGTAVLVTTPKHRLLFDTGPKYSEKFDAGGGIIQPYLQSEGVQSLDALIVSHNDQDHSGGLQSLLDVFPIKHLYLGQPDLQKKLEINTELISLNAIETCHQNKTWEWDGVRFEFINYLLVSEKSNNQSCVLLIQYADQKILLTGDIEKPVEQQLLEFAELKSIKVLFAAHHGSHTSSSKAFIDFTQPTYVVYSAGYHNQHGHPHLDVQQLFAEQGAIPFNTAYTGALQFRWSHTQLMEINAFRLTQRHFWYWDDIGDSTNPLDEQSGLVMGGL